MVPGSRWWYRNVNGIIVIGMSLAKLGAYPSINPWTSPDLIQSPQRKKLTLCHPSVISNGQRSIPVMEWWIPRPSLWWLTKEALGDIAGSTTLECGPSVSKHHHHVHSLHHFGANDIEKLLHGKLESSLVHLPWLLLVNLNVVLRYVAYILRYKTLGHHLAQPRPELVNLLLEVGDKPNKFLQPIGAAGITAWQQCNKTGRMHSNIMMRWEHYLHLNGVILSSPRRSNSASEAPDSGKAHAYQRLLPIVWQAQTMKRSLVCHGLEF